MWNIYANQWYNVDITQHMKNPLILKVSLCVISCNLRIITQYRTDTGESARQPMSKCQATSKFYSHYDQWVDFHSLFIHNFVQKSTNSTSSSGLILGIIRYLLVRTFSQILFEATFGIYWRKLVQGNFVTTLCKLTC